MISIVQGDDQTLTFTFKTSAGTAYSLANCTIFATVKTKVEDEDADAVIATTLDLGTAALGIATWNIVPSDTKYLLGTYKMDIQLKDSLNKITTVMRDDFIVLDERTKRTS